MSSRSTQWYDKGGIDTSVEETRVVSRRFDSDKESEVRLFGSSPNAQKKEE